MSPKLTDKIAQRRRDAREAARERLAEIVREAVKDDEAFHRNKPDVMKQIDEALDRHIFKPLFT